MTITKTNKYCSIIEKRTLSIVLDLIPENTFYLYYYWTNLTINMYHTKIILFSVFFPLCTWSAPDSLPLWQSSLFFSFPLSLSHTHMHNVPRIVDLINGCCGAHTITHQAVLKDCAFFSTGEESSKPTKDANKIIISTFLLWRPKSLTHTVHTHKHTR